MVPRKSAPQIAAALGALLLGASLAALLPAREPAAPDSTCAAAPRETTVELLFAGDVMQHLPQVHAARRGDGFDYEEVFRAVAPWFRRADLAVVNLETTLTRSGTYTGYPCFRSPAELAGALRRAGVDVAVLANNHCCDGGRSGVGTTLEVCDRVGLRRTGLFADSTDRAWHHPLRITRRGIRFALLNYTYGTNGMPVPSPAIVNRIDTAAMARDLAAAADAECRVVCIHWGNEYERRPNGEQRHLAEFLRRHGADVIIGSHPHVVQPSEADSAHVVVYSLGNFVSNQRRRYCDGGIMARVTVTRRGDGTLRYALEEIPVWVAMPGYRILPAPVADTMRLGEGYRLFRSDLDALWKTSYRFSE